MSQPRAMALRHRRPPPGRRERGMVLLVVLVVLVMMFMAGMAVMRSADNANVLSGNFSFQQGAMQASDRALSDALTTIANRVAAGAGNTDVANQYLSAIATPNAQGLPASVDWDSVACVDDKGIIVADCAADSGNYRVQYVIERLCSADPDLADMTDIRARCAHDASDTAATAAAIGLHYRVLIRVRGPRGTQTWYEALVSGPASI